MLIGFSEPHPRKGLDKKRETENKRFNFNRDASSVLIILATFEQDERVVKTRNRPTKFQFRLETLTMTCRKLTLSVT